MQYEGAKLRFDDIPEVVNMEWINDGEFRLRNPEEFTYPKYHDNCPVGWRTTQIDDIARFLPELKGKELDEAFKKFRCADARLFDWVPSQHATSEYPNKYRKLFPIFNFQLPGCYSVLGYCGDFPGEPSTEHITLFDVLNRESEDDGKGQCSLESKRMSITKSPRNPRDPCIGIVPPRKPKPPPPQGHCCSMFDINPPKPPPAVVTPVPEPPKEEPKPPIVPGEDPCMKYENLPDVSAMSDADWAEYDLMGEHGYKSRPWIRLPTLNFLPTDVDRIIAGEKGYLVVDGGWQPRDRIEGEYDLPMQDKWDLNEYPAQTITVVCNPLLKRFEYIPPFPDRRLNHKMARMEVIPDPAWEDGRNMFNIYFVGYNFTPSTNEFEDELLPNSEDMPVQDEVIVAVYNSNVKTWLTTFTRQWVRPLLTNQTNNVSLLKSRLYWISEWADHGKRIKVQNNAFEPPELKWIPVIACFDLQTQQFTGYSFPQELYHKRIENPLLLECNGNLYVVSRATATNKKTPQGRFEVRLAAYEEGSVKLEFKKIGRMPRIQYDFLFNGCYMCVEHVTEPAYECRAGFSVICFYVPQCGTGVLFDVDKGSWVNMERHPGWDLGKKAKGKSVDYGSNAMASCIWEPDFKALWTKEYRGPLWDPLGDDPTGPDKWPEPVLKTTT